MAFPDINQFPESHPGPYERQMGAMIVALLGVFADDVSDAESNTRVKALATLPARWSAGHAVFNEVRKRLLAASKSRNEMLEWQYSFEESCCQALYNAIDPSDPFDAGSAFFVVPQAIALARYLGVPIMKIVNVIAPH